MVKCKDCGLKGNMMDREKFMQHGYAKDGEIHLSCKICGSDNLTNTFWENFFFYLQWSIIFVIFSPCLIFVIPDVVRWRKANNG